MKKFKQFFKNIKHWNFRLKAGSLILLIFLVLGFVVPLFIHEDVNAWSTYPKNLGVSFEHLLGTTSLGQDIFKLLTLAIRNSFIIGVVVSVIGTIVGVFLGLLAGFAGGMVDRIIMLFTDAFIVIPSLPILILIANLVSGSAALFYFIVLLSVFSWSWPARQIRSMSLELRERDFISTAQFSGNSTFRILLKEIFPFVSTWSFANFINGILSAIGQESSLAVIGMSMNSMATLGTMIYWANQHQAMLSGHWLWIGSPVVTIAVLFIALFLTMNGYQSYSSKRRGQVDNA